MAFCSNCGKKISANAKFCPECGAAVEHDNGSERENTFEGKVHKCPNCGEPIKAFSTKCPLCGYEFRDAQSSSTIKEFARQLQEIESRRKGKTKFSAVAEAFGMKGGDTTDEQKINLIRSFSVPNTKEDVLEFMILASSNIDETAYENNANSTDKSVSNAWIAKTDQVYQKAKLTFGTEPEFARIQEMYDSKMKAVKKSKGKPMKIVLGCLIIYAALMGVLFFMGGSTDRKIEKLDNQLNATVAEIQVDISNGDYDSALIKANTLHFNSSLSKSKAEDWDEQREALIKLIEQKKEEGK